MTMKMSILLLMIFVMLTGAVSIGDKSKRRANEEVVEIKMPGVRPTKPDEYICTSIELPEEELYATNFVAVSEGARAHHMLLFGCAEPASTLSTWACEQICSKGSPSVMYAWGKNAPETKLPKDVGFLVSGSTNIKSLVLQMHYSNPLLDEEESDYSGIDVTLSFEKQKFTAGVYVLYLKQLQIPPQTASFNGDISCQYNGRSILHPIAYRVHAHGIGKVITAYHNNGSWYELGKGNPQWPQSFFPVIGKHEIHPGEFLAGRCIYDSSSRRSYTGIGGKHSDEMCNFYLMYYTNSSTAIPYIDCVGNQFPSVASQMPLDANELLPANPLLEAEAETPVNKGNPFGHDSELLDQRSPLDTVWDDPRGRQSNSWPNNNWNWLTKQANQIYRDGNRGNNPQNNYDYFDNGMDVDPAEYYYYENVANQRSRNRGNKNRYSDLDTGGSYNNNGQQYNADSDGFFGNSNNGQGWNNGKGYNDGGGASYDRQSGPIINQSPSSTQPPLGNKPGAGIPKKTIDIDDNKRPSIIEVNDGWPFEHLPLGEISGLAVDTQDRLTIFHRGTRHWSDNSFDPNNKFAKANEGPIRTNTLITYDQAGSVVRQLGANMFYMPHGLFIDSKDQIWVTDVALHQVFRFPADGNTPDLTLGTKLEPGSDKAHFCKPTDVAVLPTGEFFIADGYCNNRIMKFSVDGTFILEWGTSSTDASVSGLPPTSSFAIVHSLVYIPDKDWIAAADRENGRIQIFDTSGKFIKQIHHPEFGRLFAVSYSVPDKLLFAINGPDIYKHDSAVSGFVITPDGGSIVDTFGVPLADGDLGFTNPHDIAVSSTGEYAFVGETNPPNVYMFHIQRDKLQIKAAGKHQSVKKAGVASKGRAAISSSDVDTELEDRLADELQDEEGTFGASITIGLLLVVPVTIIVIITTFLRLKKNGKLSFGKKDYKNRRFNLGQFFNRHKGFDPLSQDDGGELDHLNSDSDIDEYSATTHKA